MLRLRVEREPRDIPRSARAAMNHKHLTGHNKKVGKMFAEKEDKREQK